MNSDNNKPWLAILGYGIKFGGHLTPEVNGFLKAADLILYAAADPLMGVDLEEYSAEVSPFPTYGSESYQEVYDRWIELLVQNVKAGRKVCGIFYGHPTNFVYAGFRAFKMVKAMGQDAYLLPGISTQDCLLADLGLDPSTHGMQLFEATYFLKHYKHFSVNTSTCLFQIANIGRQKFSSEPSWKGIALLAEVLSERYDPFHDVFLYQAASHILEEFKLEVIPIEKLPKGSIDMQTTLYIPPLKSIKPDQEMINKMLNF